MDENLENTIEGTMSNIISHTDIIEHCDENA